VQFFDMLPLHFNLTRTLTSRREVIGELHPQPVSSVLPKALVRRMAISGLIPDLAVITLLSACRVTPRIIAPSEIDNPRGLRHAFRMLRPGCTEFS
jgi:hypothetical protein